MYRAELLVKIPSDGFRTNMGLVLLTMLKSPYNPPTDHYHKSVHIVREIEKEGEREREREENIEKRDGVVYTASTGHWTQATFYKFYHYHTRYYKQTFSWKKVYGKGKTKTFCVLSKIIL